MKKKIKSTYQIPDYRVTRPTVFLEENGSRVVSVSQLSSCKIGDCTVSFLTPNQVTLLFNKSRKELEKARQTFDTIFGNNIEGKLAYDVSADELTVLYDYFEHIQATIITIYSAIEALCNAAIPASFTLTKKNNKGITETWDKASIEKWTPTEEKVGKIVPEILGIDSPRKLSCWNGYKKLKYIRDEIIHQKQSPEDPATADTSFLALLLNKAIFATIHSGFELIKYFCEMDKKHLHFPLLDPAAKEYITEENDFHGTFSERK